MWLDGWLDGCRIIMSVMRMVEILLRQSYWTVALLSFCKSSGIRRGIHLDAMDRLLLLSREHIDRIMTEYKPPEEDEATCHVQ